MNSLSKKLNIGFIILFLLAIWSNQSILYTFNSLNSEIETKFCSKRLLKTNLNTISDDPIIIQSDEDLELVASNGSGTINDPFIIENHNITSSGIGIKITGVSKGFIIRKCIINSFDHCISIGESYVEYSKIEDNLLLSNNSIGITIYDTNEILIDKNEIIALNDIAINIRECNNTIIQNNNCSGGILVNYSNFTDIYNNTCFFGFNGIKAYKSDNSNIIENKLLSNSNNGIEMLDSSNCYLVKNNCSKNGNDGIRSYHNNKIEISSNYCYKNNNSGIVLIGNLINELSFVSNNTCNYNSLNGIEISRLFQINITKNYCFMNKESGIDIRETYYCKIFDNFIIFNTKCGICVSFDGFNLDIYNNLFAMNCYGLTFESDECRHNIIRFNSFDYFEYARLRHWGGHTVDNGSENTWFGNYYHDYDGKGKYSIPGSANSYDPMPIVVDEYTSNIEKYNITSIIEYGYIMKKPLFEIFNDPFVLGFIFLISFELTALFSIIRTIRKNKKLKLRE